MAWGRIAETHVHGLPGPRNIMFNSWSTLAGEPARLPVVPCDPALFVTREVP
jgi:hypothetical protein